MEQYNNDACKIIKILNKIIVFSFRRDEMYGRDRKLKFGDQLQNNKKIGGFIIGIAS